MGVFFAKLLELFFTGNKNNIFRLIILVCFLLIFLPIILDYFYGNIRLEQEIKLLKELNSINKNDITDERLREHYEDIINLTVNRKLFRTFITINVINRDTSTLNSRFKFFTSENIIKFISGAFWWVLLFIIGIFTKQKTIGSKIGLLIFLVCLIVLFGSIGIFIPSFTLKIINVIGFPLLQLIIGLLIGFIIVKINKTKQK
jgi:hypothetical protein